MSIRGDWLLFVGLVLNIPVNEQRSLHAGVLSQQSQHLVISKLFRLYMFQRMTAVSLEPVI